MGSRYVGALTMATAAKISDIAASRQQLIAENQQAQSALVAANSAQRKALADKEAALSSLALAQAEYNVAKGSAAEMLALDALIAAETRATMASATYAEAKLAQAAASTTAAAAARAASVGVGLAGKALSLIGGPAGAAMLAAGAIFYFWQKAQQAREEAIRFADGLDRVNASMKAMNNTQLRGTIADANKSIRAQKDEISDLQSEVDSLRSRYQNFTPEAQAVAESMGQGADFARQQAEVSDQLNQKTRDLANAQDKLARTQDTAAEANRTLNNNMLTAMGVHEQLIQKGWSLEQVQGAVAKAFGLTADEINRANQAGQNFNPKALQISPPTEEGDKNILNLKEQNELLKIRDERTRAVRKAEMEQAKVTKNKNQIEEQGRLAGENFDLKKAEEERQEAQRKSEQQDKRSATAAESVAQKLEQLRQESVLAADSTEGLTREQQLLRAEQSLGAHATDEQKKKARDYKAAALDAAAAAKGVSEALRAMPEQAENKSYADSMQNLKAALNAGKIDQQEYNAATEQMEQQHQANLAKIRAQQTVSPMQEARGQIDPVQQLANQHAQELALIQQFETQKGQITQRGLELMNAANTQYEQQRIAAQWEIWRQQNAGYEVAAAAFDSFAGNASNALTGILTGSMSVSEAMSSLGSTVLNSVINSFVQMGVEWLKSVIMGQAGMTAASGMAIAQGQLIAASMAPAAAMTSLATAGANAVPAQAGIASTVGMAQALSIAGARYNGGPVSAGGLYQVGEKGKPEIYQASTGKQYMIPGDNGKVISNKDMQSGGGISVQVNVINQSTGATVQSADGYMQDGSAVVDLLITDIERGGPVSSQMQQTFGLSRKAQGAY